MCLLPFAKVIIWPTLVSVVIWRYNIQIGDILARIAAGASLKIGGLEIGGTQKPPEKPNAAISANPDKVAGLPHHWYLSHIAERDAQLDKGGARYYRLLIWLDSDTEDELDAVKEVTYHLHPTFVNPKRESKDRGGKFNIKTAGWGEFAMAAEITFKDGRPPLIVERYINFGNGI